MIKRFIFLAVLVQMANAQTLSGDSLSGAMDGYTTEVISEWSSGPFLHEDLNAQCIEDCNRTCVEECPEAKLCKEDEIECGKLDFPGIVWPDCIKDDICVPDDCECKYGYLFKFVYIKLVLGNVTIDHTTLKRTLL